MRYYLADCHQEATRDVERAKLEDAMYKHSKILFHAAVASVMNDFGGRDLFTLVGDRGDQVLIMSLSDANTVYGVLKRMNSLNH